MKRRKINEREAKKNSNVRHGCLTSGNVRYFPIGIFRSGLWDVRDRINYRWMCGITVLHNKGRGYRVLILSSNDMNGGSYKRMNAANKERFCRYERGSLLLLLSAEKRCEGHG